MKVWNLTVSKAEDGSKVLDLQIHGVIDGGPWDETSVSTAEIAKALAEHPDAKKINQSINSIGGSMFGGIALFNLLQAHGAEVTSNVVGLAASAASIAAMAGKTVMHQGAMLMIHNPWAGVAGDAQQLRKAAAFLDKGRDGLLSVYKSKTGKDNTELKAMLDATTFLTADEAMRKGFANEIAGGNQTIENHGDVVAFNAVAFPRDTLPPEILALAALKNPVSSTSVPPENGPPAGGRKDEKMVITREILAKDAPDLLKAIVAEANAAGVEEGKKVGHVDGITAERARMKAIDDLELKGCEELVAEAKYGDKPIEAPALAVSALKAGRQAGIDLLAARRKESEEAASIRQSTPEKKTEAAELEAAKNIAEYANKRRGGSR